MLLLQFRKWCEDNKVPDTAIVIFGPIGTDELPYRGINLEQLEYINEENAVPAILINFSPK